MTQSLFLDSIVIFLDAIANSLDTEIINIKTAERDENVQEDIQYKFKVKISSFPKHQECADRKY